MSQTIHSACRMIHCYNLKKYAQGNNSHMYTPFWFNVSKTIKTQETIYCIKKRVLHFLLELLRHFLLQQIWELCPRCMQK